MAVDETYADVRIQAAENKLDAHAVREVRQEIRSPELRVDR